MSCYLIAVGGTGAKIAEATLHLAAAGILPSPCELSVLFVDTDEGNGSLGRAIRVAQRYLDCYGLFNGTISLFNANVNLVLRVPWSPIGKDTKTLRSIFAPTQVEEDVMRCLFTDTDPSVLGQPDPPPGEIELDLTEGFRARAAIGSAVWAHTLNWAQSRPFEQLAREMRDKRQNHNVKVMLTGSIFGGTGASGVPTIARLLHEEIGKDTGGKNFEIGLLPALPYFTYGDVGRPGEITADPSAFLANTKQALDYYEKRGYLKFFEAIYLIGDECPAQMRKPAVGRGEQTNEPLYTELMAALGIAHFYHAAPGEAGGDGGKPIGHLYLSSRENKLKLTWNDLPMDESVHIAFEKKLRQLARFAVALRYCFEPTITSVYKDGAAYRAPWYIDFLKRKNKFDEAENRNLESVKLYCESFLEWSMDVTRPNTQGFETRLFDRAVFCREKDDRRLRLASDDEFRLSGLEGLFVDKQEERASLDDIWAKACDTKPPHPPLDGVARALQAIYSSC
jgi:hypothetical protein